MVVSYNIYNKHKKYNRTKKEKQKKIFNDNKHKNRFCLTYIKVMYFYSL